MDRRILKARDIEQLENTSPATPFADALRLLAPKIELAAHPLPGADPIGDEAVEPEPVRCTPTLGSHPAWLANARAAREEGA